MPSRTSPPPRARRTQADRSAATRQALVAAARQLFAELGFAEVPTDSIVAAAGVTRGALYHQFADKTALFDAVMEAVEADVARRLADAVGAAGISDPVEALRHAVRTWLDICIEREIHRIALIDGPSVLAALARSVPAARFRPGADSAAARDRTRRSATSPRGRSHMRSRAGDEAALYVAEAADHAQARAEMIEVLDQLLAGVTVFRWRRAMPCTVT